jgi:hypothetical protein
MQPAQGQVIAPAQAGTVPPPVQPAQVPAEAGASDEHVCANCSGVLVFSLARSLWFCPACGTEAPGIPPPSSQEGPIQDEAMGAEQQMLGQPSSDMPAGPLPGEGEEAAPAMDEKPPDEMGGVTREKAAEAIIELQNLIEAKSKTGLYSLDSETAFESCKIAFTQNDYPAVIQLNKQIKELLEKAESDMKAENLAATAGEQGAMPVGDKRTQAVTALKSARNLIGEAERLGYDITESKKIFKQAEPAFRAGDFETTIHYAHDVEESVSAVLGGKRLAKAPIHQPDYQPGFGETGEVEEEDSDKDGKRPGNEFFLHFLLPIVGIVILMTGATLAYISYADNIWNPFSDGPYDWGAYNTAGVILGLVGVIIGVLFAILPMLLTKKVHVRMEPPKPVSAK